MTQPYSSPEERYDEVKGGRIDMDVVALHDHILEWAKQEAIGGGPSGLEPYHKFLADSLTVQLVELAEKLGNHPPYSLMAKYSVEP